MSRSRSRTARTVRGASSSRRAPTHPAHSLAPTAAPAAPRVARIALQQSTRDRLRGYIWTKRRTSRRFTGWHPTLRRVLWAVVAVQAVLAAGFAFELDAALKLWPFGGGRADAHLRRVDLRGGRRLDRLVRPQLVDTGAHGNRARLHRDPRPARGLLLRARRRWDRAAWPSRRPRRRLRRGRDRAAGDDRARAVARASADANLRARLLRGLRRLAHRVDVPARPEVAVAVARHRRAVDGDRTHVRGRGGLLRLWTRAVVLENAGGQLAGFLAYDAVLIWPFLKRLPDVAPEFRLELWTYTAVVVYSAIVAIVYLALHPVTRGRHRRAPAASPPALPDDPRSSDDDDGAEPSAAPHHRPACRAWARRVGCGPDRRSTTSSSGTIQRRCWAYE